ncbi:phage portal protein [Paramicrobacterium chengjingii]|uniref:phage portal protein n=1 Tax=Paramicrobacterium chengjingii TaxID=2769067 RepID=UPI00141E7771|nr:phage portal protein [Microbacterium chengjingii]
MSDQFPPAPWDLAFERFRELDAWWSGNTVELNDIYSHRRATHTVGGRQYSGGVVGTLTKWFLGQPIDPDEKRMIMHVPFAADICTLSSDLLFAEEPNVFFRNPDKTPDPAKEYTHPAQDRLEQIIGTDEAHAELMLGGEFGAALGGTYWAVAWDPAVADHVFPKAYAADLAIPEFRYGRLASVKLWTEYHDGNQVFRLIEEHQPGTIEYTLFKGTAKTLGNPVPIGSRPETAHYEQLRNPSDVLVSIDDPGKLPESVKIGTGSDRLAVTYMPNARPVIDWRKQGQLAYLGRSDLDGNQDLLDKLDQTWSSMMRDMENGQGRLVVPEHFLDVGSKPGDGASFDTYRQVFAGVNTLGGSGQTSDSQITVAQFAIRVEEHFKIIEEVSRTIASRAGYSAAHLGLDATRGLKTATQVQADLSDSERTRDKKALFARAALARWSVAALEIDKAVFGGPELGDMSRLPDVEFSPVSQADPEKTARTLQMLDAARAASRKEIVRALHPEWTEREIQDEADLIMREQGYGAPDPAMFTGDDGV